MSIYVAIPCLGIDTELSTTIYSCLNTSSGKYDININVAMIYNEEFFYFIKNKFKDNKNVNISYYPFDGNIGIGIGRELASSNYNNEDYFLQIDAHMLFKQDWDLYLVNKFNKAKDLVNNEKTIICGVPAEYYYTPENNIAYSNELYYPVWDIDRHMPTTKLLPKSADLRLKDTPKHIQEHIENTGFAPLTKIYAGLIFSNKHFANNRNLDRDLLFWEEEVFQTIELINDGFTLVYPGGYSPICHYYQTLNEYSDTIAYRDGISTLEKKGLLKYSDSLKITEHNCKTFIKNNIDKILLYKQYCGLDIREYSKTGEDTPIDYINKNYLPIYNI